MALVHAAGAFSFVFNPNAAEVDNERVFLLYFE